MIPKVIYQTWETKELPDSIKCSIEKIKDLNPEYIHILFDASDRLEFIKENFDDDVLTAYNRINIGAAKADLWRLCVIYKNGGVYLDIKSGINKSLDDLINGFDGMIFSRECHKGYFLNWAFISSPNNPLIKKCIDKIVNYILNNKCTSNDSPWLITGPCLLSKTIKETLSQTAWEDEDKIYKDNSTGFLYKLYGIDFNGALTYKIVNGDDIYTNDNLRWRNQIHNGIMLFSS